MADTPLTLAETASVFGEMLTFQAMLRQTDDPIARRAMLAGKIEDMINTVIRQTAFCLFERDVHDARLENELTSDEIGDIWINVQTESLGPVFRFRDEYRHYWAYILISFIRHSTYTHTHSAIAGECALFRLSGR